MGLFDGDARECSQGNPATVRQELPDSDSGRDCLTRLPAHSRLLRLHRQAGVLVEDDLTRWSGAVRYNESDF